MWHPAVTQLVKAENRLVRQPRIIGHTSRDHHIHEYHYKQAHRCYKWFIWPSRQDNASCQTWLYTECLMAAEDISKATARSGSTPQVLAGLLILALLTPTPHYGRRWSSLKTWHKTPAPKGWVLWMYSQDNNQIPWINQQPGSKQAVANIIINMA